MNLVELQPDEYMTFALKHPYYSFTQDIKFAELKKFNNWKSVLLGLKDKDKILGASLFLIKELPLNKKIYYAPHGLLIDYSDHELVKTMTLELKKYMKKKGAIFFKIEPYLMKVRRDNEAEIVENDIDNRGDYDYLKKLGFIEVNGDNVKGRLKRKWQYVLDVENKTFDELFNNMDSSKRRKYRQNIDLGIKIKKLDLNDIELFYNIMENTSTRKGFASREKEYYEKMLSLYSDTMKINYAYFDCDETIKKLQNNIDNLNIELNDLKEKNSKRSKAKNRIKLLEEDIARFNKQIDTFKDYQKEGNTVPLSAVLFIETPQELIAFIGGTFEKYTSYAPFYNLIIDTIKEATLKGKKQYNFYGINEKPNPEGKDYNLYFFKKGFNGEVRELFGEFDYPVNKLMYFLYNVAFNTRLFISKLKIKIKKLFYKKQKRY